MENLFENATRLKARFKTKQGLVTTEDLWDMSLESLDTLAKSLNKETKESAEESFIKTRTNKDKELEIRFEVVKHVISVKLKEEEKRAEAAEKRKKKARLVELIADKENELMSAKSIEELQNELNAIDA